MTKVLIVEDEPRIAAFLCKGLEARGFSTLAVDNGQSAVYLANSHDFDLVILDLGLPDLDGLTVLNTIRGQGETIPIIVLTVYDDLHHKVSGLNSGADDYITKPFQLEELIARIQVQLRKKPQAAGQLDPILKVGDISLDFRQRQVKKLGQIVELSTREFTLLELFMRRNGETISRLELLNEVWGYDYDISSNVVDVYVGYLRKKLGARLIETVRGVGFRFKA
ncbi:response regulator [Synechococcales cyanobacterium C]|uniref:Response regulator n=1 Tax=Petrachloros mirabilis ULC683 TaxID=2781853 RepID=A0A8K1ZYB3_9CYAN|nr:response regulator transcription factor [Petrachloros mirabilis]NCJ06251.1 response regulator [Petrachloros mirabilis ULC683]